MCREGKGGGRQGEEKVEVGKEGEDGERNEG